MLLLCFTLSDVSFAGRGFGGGRSSSYSSSRSTSRSYSRPSSKSTKSYSSKKSRSTRYTSGTKSKTSGRKAKSYNSSKSRAAKKLSSKKKYVATKKATAPPKTSYVSSTGKKVNVRTNSTHVKKIRNKPSSYHTPQARRDRLETHIDRHDYSQPMSWYYQQPAMHVGGGYSSAFWWIMMTEWSAQRRAEWLYHNQGNIEESAYKRGLKDAEVQQQLEELKEKKVAKNPDYVDSDFKGNPDMMYSQEYVEAAYNPKEEKSSLGFWLLVIVGLGIIGGVVYFIVFRLKF